jgi:hypothetical protein
LAVLGVNTPEPLFHSLWTALLVLRSYCSLNTALLQPSMLFQLALVHENMKCQSFTCHAVAGELGRQTVLFSMSVVSMLHWKSH